MGVGQWDSAQGGIGQFLFMGDSTDKWQGKRHVSQLRIGLHLKASRGAAFFGAIHSFNRTSCMALCSRA